MRLVVTLLLLASCRPVPIRTWDWHVPHPSREQIPIRVYAPEADGAARAAARLWNRAAGCEIIHITHELGPAHVVVMHSDEGLSDAALGGMFRWLEADGTLRGEVRVRHLLPLGQMFWLLSHEFGHMLGLAHDAYFVLKPRMAYGPDEELHGAFPRVQDADAAALHERYCQR